MREGSTSSHTIMGSADGGWDGCPADELPDYDAVLLWLYSLCGC